MVTLENTIFFIYTTVGTSNVNGCMLYNKNLITFFEISHFQILLMSLLLLSLDCFVKTLYVLH